MVENYKAEGIQLLSNLPKLPAVPVVGITGSPGAGKSTLINALIGFLLQKKMKVGIIAVDPTSPFSHGSLLGDRIRMNDHFTNPSVFIRSMATRGSLGGLSPKIVEAVDLLKAAKFDYIIIETVGVGQSEVEIASLADTTVVVLVPESGDEVQNIKSGVMETADVFVVNKADRPGADAFFNTLKSLVHSKVNSNWETPVVKTVADTADGIDELFAAIQSHRNSIHSNEKKIKLLIEKALQLIREKRTADIDFDKLRTQIENEIVGGKQNLYTFVQTNY